MTYYEPQDFMAGSGGDDDLLVDSVGMAMWRMAGHLVQMAEPVSRIGMNRSDQPRSWSVH
ncbi:hypothetical protein BVC71_02745 [Marivivens niveibacter]|uniref:Uncharacterized protein n=1 Tax=Marivivens niveibacter TaxID=1930667 RepID=A0A251X168_9RHOB|nr:hypothetical protein [Marivivens niveibacter]OUD10437.1 hypothetical protein BVC71_02745 [Marivivens niveibacter]